MRFFKDCKRDVNMACDRVDVYCWCCCYCCCCGGVVVGCIAGVDWGVFYQLI